MKKILILLLAVLAVFALGNASFEPSRHGCKTVKITIDLDADGSTDFVFDDTAENSTSQNVDLGAVLPAYAEILSAQIRCYESVGGAQTFQVTLGTASAGSEILAQATVDAAGEITGTGAGDGPEIVAAVSAKNVWINGAPSGDWDEAGGTGRWSVMVTYIDYGDIHTYN